jgi:carboxyl-terminal processing protease
MKKLAVSVSLLTLSFQAFSFAPKPIEQHWAETNITYAEQIADLNDGSCMKTKQAFMACLSALNAALKFDDPSFESLHVPQGPNFVVRKIPVMDPESKKQIRAYVLEMASLYDTLKMGPRFSQAFSDAGKKYVGTNKEAFFAAIVFNGYLGSFFDPHTYIVPASLLKEQSQSSQKNKLFGFGYRLTTVKDQPRLVVLTADASTPAGKAGMRPGDLILDINGEKDALKQPQVIGLKDTVTMTLEGSTGTRTITMTKAELERSQLETKIIADKKGRKFGYMKLDSFVMQEACSLMFEAGIEFRNQSVDGVVLDLRNNGGGDVEVAKCIMSLYLEDGSASWVQKKPGSKAEVFQLLDPKYLFNDLHTVTLINGGSASASEATAMFLQAYRKSFIVGERSFGKGTMQRIQKSANPLVYMGITIAKYYGPHGVSPQIQGVRPDVEILPEVGQSKPTPYQREEDLFVNVIPNPPQEVPEMLDRKVEVKSVQACVASSTDMQSEYASLDDYQKRIYDRQLKSGIEVINCANDLKIPIFTDTNIPRLDVIN